MISSILIALISIVFFVFASMFLITYLYNNPVNPDKNLNLTVEQRTLILTYELKVRVTHLVVGLVCLFATGILIKLI